MRCNKCDLEILGRQKNCPLCQEPLSGDAGERLFPAVPLRIKMSRRFLKIVSFISIAAAAVCVAVNLSIPGSKAWSLFVIAGIACFWLSVGVVIKKMGNVPKTIFLQVLLISVAAVLWDIFTGFHKWSLDYVVPILFICSMIAMVVIARIMKLKTGDYLIYLIMDILIGVASITLILCGVLTVLLPSVLCATGSVIFLSALILFEGKSLISELHRRTHI